MEPTEKPRDPNDLREYEAIPHATRSMVMMGVMAVILAAINAVVWSAGRNALRAEDSRGVLFAFAALGMAAVSMLAFWVVARSAIDPDLNETVRGWFKAYWRRNVRGYVTAYWAENGGPRWFTFRRGDEYVALANKHPPLVVFWPLGGWFHRPQVYWYARPSRWSAARNMRFPCTPVAVTDMNGSTLRFGTIEHAMSFIADGLERAAAQPFFRDSSDVPFSWLRVLDGLSKQHDDAQRQLALTERERKESERQRAELEQQMEKLFDRIHAAVGGPPYDPERPLMERIEDTLRQLIVERNYVRGERDEMVKFVNELAGQIERDSRISGMIGALQLLDRMLNLLCWSSVRDSPEHLAFQNRLAVVRAKLAEKQRRDRRRHGKPATPTAL